MLNRQELRQRIADSNLIRGYINLDKQLTPNGFDLTAGDIFSFDSAGALDFSNTERMLPGGAKLCPVKKNENDKWAWWHLEPGAYKVKTNEVITLTNDLVAMAFPRSSLLRMGAYTQCGVWDAGFSGQSEFILIVNNPFGVSVKQNARVIQIVFLPVNEVDSGYSGIYQGQS